MATCEYTLPANMQRKPLEIRTFEDDCEVHHHIKWGVQM